MANILMTGTYAVKVSITLLTKDDEDNIIEVTHPMEALKKAGLEEFIASFSLTPFECTNIAYNSIGRVSRIEVKQLEI